jgi:hypothetical protein
MRALAPLLLAAALSGCAVRASAYRFSSPMLGTADVPPSWSGQASVRGPDVRHPVDPYGPVANHERIAPTIRVASARDVPSCSGARRDGSTCVAASASAADDVLSTTRGLAWSRLPAPNRLPAEAAARPVRELADLRALVGRRDKRDALAASLGWLRDFSLGLVDHDLREARTANRMIRELLAWADSNPSTTIADLVDRARSHDQLGDPHDDIFAGDLLVFDRTDSDNPSDLVAIAIGRDVRGVVEFVYVAGGTIRRGFVDVKHPAQRRDASGAVLNTFMRAGKRWPPKGTHYLAGELVSHVVRLH